MVAERKIAATAMDVDLLAEIAHRHCRALDVPAWPPGAKARRPRRLVRPGTAPQRKIQNVALGPWPDRAQQSFIAQLTNHRAARAMRQAPIPAIPARVEIESVRLIRVTGGIKPRSRFEDAPDLVRDAWHEIGRTPAQGVHVADMDRGLAIGEPPPINTVPSRTLEERT